MDGAWYVPVSFSSRSQYSDPTADSPVRGWVEPATTLELTLPAKSASEWLIVNLDRTGKPEKSVSIFGSPRKAYHLSLNMGR